MGTRARCVVPVCDALLLPNGRLCGIVLADPRSRSEIRRRLCLWHARAVEDVYGLKSERSIGSR
jgi:hypothetical protein